MRRSAISNDPIQAVNGNASDSDRRASVRDRGTSLQNRPSTTQTLESSPDESEVDRTKSRPKPPLRRAKSDFGPRGEERDSQDDEEIHYGAKHGFEDHYASEEYVSQLANVSRAFPLQSHSRSLVTIKVSLIFSLQTGYQISFHSCIG
jgi:regulator-associated protein of mTOR